jgi:hypothetical protein
MQLELPQLAMRPSVYRPGVIYPKLESYFPCNKGLRDKIRLNLNFSIISRAWRSDHQPQAASGRSKIGRQHEGMDRWCYRRRSSARWSSACYFFAIISSHPTVPASDSSTVGGGGGVLIIVRWRSSARWSSACDFFASFSSHPAVLASGSPHDPPATVV